MMILTMKKLINRFDYLPSDWNAQQAWNKRKGKMQRRAPAGGPISDVFIQNRQKNYAISIISSSPIRFFFLSLSSFFFFQIFVVFSFFSILF